MNFASFDLNLLRVLDALLATGSATRAGERIGLSQPAVSAALGRLRHALGDPLFVRQGRQLAATDYARSLQEPLRQVLEQAETLLAGPAPFDPSSAEGSFKLSGSDFFAEMLMPELAGRLSRLAPGMRVQLVDLVPDNYVQTLVRYQVDMALLPRTDFPEWADCVRLLGSRFLVIARAGHPDIAAAGLAEGEEMPVELFCGLQHVLFSPEGNLRGLGDAALAAAGYRRDVAMTLPVFSGVVSAVAQSRLIALLPQALAERMAPRAGLALYRPPVPVGPVDIMLVWHRRSTNAPAHRWLRDQIATVLAPLDGPAAP